MPDRDQPPPDRTEPPGRRLNARERACERALGMLGEDTVCRFLRHARPGTEILAVQLVNESLDQGRTVREILLDGEDFGFYLSARRRGPRLWAIDFGCQAGPTAGDGGSWMVTLDESGAIRDVRSGPIRIS